MRPRRDARQGGGGDGGGGGGDSAVRAQLRGQVADEVVDLHGDAAGGTLEPQLGVGRVYGLHHLVRGRVWVWFGFGFGLGLGLRLELGLRVGLEFEV